MHYGREVKHVRHHPEDHGKFATNSTQFVNPPAPQVHPIGSHPFSSPAGHPESTAFFFDTYANKETAIVSNQKNNKNIRYSILVYTSRCGTRYMTCKYRLQSRYMFRQIYKQMIQNGGTHLLPLRILEELVLGGLEHCLEVLLAAHRRNKTE